MRRAVIQLRVGALLALVSARCVALEELPSRAAETGGAACADGLDNDFDGLLDCGDPDCGCNRCGERVDPALDADALGQSCARDCECPEGQVCNLAARIASAEEGLRQAGRCSPEVSAEEDAFDVRFVVAVDDARPTGPQNVLGEIRFDGETTPLRSLEGPFPTMDLRSEGREATLFVQLFPPLGLAPEIGLRYRLQDDVFRRAGPEDPVVLQAYFALLFFGIDPTQLPLNTKAVVDTATLAFDPVEETPPGHWRGRFWGRLRPVAGFDRARRPTCPVEGDFFDPISTRCTPLGATPAARIYFGCPAGPGPDDSGRVAFAWRPPGDRAPSSSPFPTFGACRLVPVERDGEGFYLLRGRTDAFLIEVVLRERDLGVDLGSRDLSVRIWPDPPAGGLFDEVGPPALGLVRSRFWVDEVSLGREGRLFAWLVGEVVEL